VVSTAGEAGRGWETADAASRQCQRSRSTIPSCVVKLLMAGISKQLKCSKMGIESETVNKYHGAHQ